MARPIPTGRGLQLWNAVPYPSSMTLAVQSRAAPPELRQHWPAVLACFATATFAWGFGFYGQSVYLAELQRLQGWSASTISGYSATIRMQAARQSR
jgi:hypothetical protein